MNFNPTFRLPKVLDLIKSSTATASATTESNHKNSTTSPLDAAAFSALMMNGANLATSHIGAASAASFTNGNGVSPLIPDMNDPAVISQLLSTFSQQQQEQLQQAASQPQLPLKAESPKSHQQQPGALDLTAISDQFQKQQFAELMFLKQMRSMLGYQPQDSNESMMTMPQATMGEQLGKIEKSSSPSLQSANKTTAVTTPHQAPPTSQPSSVSSPSIDHQEVPSSNTPLDHLLQLYGINRESYLKLLQHQEQLKQQPQPFEQQKSHETARSIDLRSPSKGFERSQTVTEEEDEDSSNEGSIDAEPVSHPSDSSSQELEKLKQLQSLYKLNLMQQQFQPSPPPPPSSLQADLTDFSFLPSLKTKKPSAGSASSATSSSNDNYVEMLHQKATAGGKTPSRRPLSSWKQSITACGPGPAPWVDKSTLYSLGIQGELINRTGPIDYTNFVKRYGNAHECGNSLCRELNYREHFHCNATSCNSRVFMKKEEMIRHFKWHKKRDESLTHGFLRCSPADNCVERFRACPHHRKQTHYHCLKRGCDKVYISTSDVQMHANYHRKDTAIIHEGFQRFRATENCLLETCAFFGQKTTHFHCRRDNCDHTFKNKADMEKHKSYHVRDEQLARDGFRKFQKHEDCAIDACRSSRVCNHIHCIRPGCQHVLHSTGQLFPHKRKHERREYEWAYRKYRLAQILRQNPDASGPALEKTLSEGLDVLSEDDSVMDNLVAQLPLTQFVVIPLEEIVGESIGEARIRKYIQRHPNAGCQRIDSDELKSSSMLRSEHFTCLSCGRCWSDYADAIQHAHKHALQEHANVLLFEETADPNICSAECILHQKDRHLHCRMFGCPFITLQTDKTLSQLEHYKFHEDQMDQFGPNADCEIKLNNNGLQIEGLQHVKIDLSAQPIAPISQGVRPSNKNKNGSPTHQVFPTGTTLTSVDGMPVLKRKRGRPPKNRSSDSSQSRNHSASSPFGFGSNGAAAFDLAAALNLSLAANGAGQDGKTIPIPLLMNQYLKQNIPLPTQLPSLAGFYGFDDKSPCPDMFCRYFGTPHYHCCRPRCYFATNREDSANSHTRDFHENVDILDWFAYFDSAIDCKMAGCNLNRSSSHFHCTRPDCNTSFAPYALMRVHDAKHNKSSDNSGIDSMKDVGETNDWQLQLQNLIAQQSKMMNSCNTTPIKEEEPDVIEPEVTPVDEPSSKTEDPNMLMVGLQAQFAQNPALAGNFLQMLMSTLMNQAGGSSTVPPVDQSGGESKAGDSQMSSPRKRRGSFSSEASSTASEYLKRPKIEEASSTSVNSVFL